MFKRILKGDGLAGWCFRCGLNTAKPLRQLRAGHFDRTSFSAKPIRIVTMKCAAPIPHTSIRRAFRSIGASR